MHNNDIAGLIDYIQDIGVDDESRLWAQRCKAWLEAETSKDGTRAFFTVGYEKETRIFDTLEEAQKFASDTGAEAVYVATVNGAHRNERGQWENRGGDKFINRLHKLVN